MSFLIQTIRWLNIGGLALSAIAMLVMMLHITLDVGIRYFFNGQIVGTLEVVSFYYMVVLVFLALGYVENRNENIRVDLFAQMMPRRAQLALYIFACLAGLVFFGMLFWQSLHDAIGSTQRKEDAMSNFTFFIWPARWALPLGFAGVFLATASNLLKSIARRQAL